MGREASDNLFNRNKIPGQAAGERSRRESTKTELGNHDSKRKERRALQLREIRQKLPLEV